MHNLTDKHKIINTTLPTNRVKSQNVKYRLDEF